MNHVAPQIASPESVHHSRTPAVLLIGAALLLCGSRGPQKSGEEQTITKLKVSELEVCDKRGAVLIRLVADEEGGHIYMKAPDGASEILLNVTQGEGEPSNPSIAVISKGGETDINVGQIAGEGKEHPLWFLGDIEDRPNCVLFDAAGKPKTFLGISTAQEGELQLVAKDGKTRVLAASGQ